VCFTVGICALALTISVYRRRQKLDQLMFAYTWFFLFTAFVWIFSAIRYLAVGFGLIGPWITFNDIVVQLSVFAGGPPLFYYLITKVYNNKRLATTFSVISFILWVIAGGLLLLPNGVPTRDVTHFTVESTVNPISFIIFSSQMAILLVLLFYDIISRLRQIKNTTFKKEEKFAILYSLGIGVYLILGSIDESKIITDWPLVVFRVLYVASFLFIYLIVSQEEETKEILLTEQKQII